MLVETRRRTWVQNVEAHWRPSVATNRACVMADTCIRFCYFRNLAKQEGRYRYFRGPRTEEGRITYEESMQESLEALVDTGATLMREGGVEALENKLLAVFAQGEEDAYQADVAATRARVQAQLGDRGEDTSASATLPPHVSTEAPRRPYLSQEAWSMLASQRLLAAQGKAAEAEAKRQEFRQRVKRDRRNWTLTQLSDRFQIKAYWGTLRQLRSNCVPRHYERKDKDGRRVPVHLQARAAAEYLEQVHGAPPPPRTAEEEREIVALYREARALGEEKYAGVEWRTDPFAYWELDRFLRGAARNKAPGVDKITQEHLLHLSPAGKRAYLELLNLVYEGGHITDAAMLARIAFLYKKGDPTMQANYRPLSLLTTFYKVLAAMIMRRLQDALELRLRPDQFGFRPNRSASYAIIVRRRLQDLHGTSRTPLLRGLPGLGKGVR